MKNNNTHNLNAFTTALIEGLEREQKNTYLKDTPFYPLAFNTIMPKEVDFENGHLSFRFKDFIIEGLHHFKIKSNDQNENEIKIGLSFNEAKLKATYEINSKYTQKINIDTAGNLQELDDSHAKAAGADDEKVAPLTQEEIDEMVTQARAQKKPIQGTYHGPTLMSTYNKHNESYNTAFATFPMLRTLWAKGGITTQMSRDTSSALNNGTVVNSSTKKYANGIGYNYNAAGQQVNISMALGALALDASKKGNKALADKYMAAAMASSSFKENVDATGNGSEPANMTGKQVYATLDDKSAKMKEISPEQYKNMLDQANDESSKDGGADEEALKNGWRVLRNDERKMMRERMFLFQEELMAIKDIKSELLWSGDCIADLQGTEAILTFTFDNAKSDWKLTNTSISLPGFALELDDSFWTGNAAKIVRKRLTSIHFVKSLLKSKVQSSIKNMLEKVATQSINIAS